LQEPLGSYQLSFVQKAQAFFHDALKALPKRGGKMNVQVSEGSDIEWENANFRHFGHFSSI
jgi:hypothetical protein